MTWDATKPEGPAALAIGDNRIRDNWRWLEDSLKAEHEFPGTTTSRGMHKLPVVSLSDRGLISNPTAGMAVFRSDRRSIDYYDGTEWWSYDGYDTGDMKITGYDPSSLPDGWLACDGASYLDATWPRLRAKILTTFGGGGGSFNVPDMGGNFPVGFKVNVTSFDTIGETGGSKTHQLTIAETPAHDHSPITIDTEPDHTHFADTIRIQAGQVEGGGDGSLVNPMTTGDDGDHDHDYIIPSSGMDTPHENRPEYLVVGFVIKAD